ncbi:MAG: DUF374 domain-containing protein [Alphaproteobacteria bacterium]|nr:DUF374 domain-containing protein [Alphaproteobacteria bacterium]
MAAATSRPPWRLPLIAALALAFASLTLISGIAYIAVLAGATGTAERLLVDRASRVVDAQVSLVRRQLDPVTDHLELVAALAASGRLDIESAAGVREALAVMMTRVPAVSSAGFATLDLKLHRAVRHPDGMVTRDTVSLVDLPQGLARFRQLQTAHNTFWGALFWSEQLKQPVLNVRTPVRRIDDAFIGGLFATVAVGDLSYLIGEAVKGSEGRYFILVGRDKVLAHRRLVDPRGLGLSEDRPLPTITEIDDPVLARFWSSPVQLPQIDRALGDLGRVVEADGRRWVFVYRELRLFGPDPWLVGVWHNRILCLPLCFEWLCRGYRRLTILTSASRDGEMLSNLVAGFGMETVRGSSSRKGVLALRQLQNRLLEGSDVGITPDGPRGPVYKVSPGLLYLAAKTGRPVMTIRVDYESYWEMRSWDGFRVPKPFSKVRITFQKTILIPPGTEGEVETQARRVEELLGR